MFIPSDPRPQYSNARRSGKDAAPSGTRTLRLLQVTDTHIFADPDGRLLGQNTRRTLDLVLELARETFWPVDRILLTGDLVHDESRDGYRYLARRLAELAVPCLCLPGNHDALAVMAERLDGGALSTLPAVRCEGWNLVLLDSTVPGHNGGHLGDAELARLDDRLRAEPQRHALICLHHQPVPVGSRWIDAMALDNRAAFFAVIDRHPQVRGVLWGHVHQDFTSHHRGVLLLGSPSTCVQFLPGSHVFALDERTPGFRWLELHPDGRIDTGIERIAAYPNASEAGARGY